MKFKLNLKRNLKFGQKDRAFCRELLTGFCASLVTILIILEVAAPHVLSVHHLAEIPTSFLVGAILCLVMFGATGAILSTLVILLLKWYYHSIKACFKPIPSYVVGREVSSSEKSLWQEDNTEVKAVSASGAKTAGFSIPITLSDQDINHVTGKRHKNILQE